MILTKSGHFGEFRPGLLEKLSDWDISRDGGSSLIVGERIRGDPNSGVDDPSEEPSGFKREFDPGSESTLAACLTHASRTRKWSNP